MSAKGSSGSEKVESERSAVAVLRRETREEHLELEHRLDLLASSLTVDRYVKVLQGFMDSYATLEPAVEAVAPSAFLERVAWSNRSKLDWLREDIEFLKGSVAVRKSPAVTLFNDAEAAIGAFYVMEGATLGAQLIRPHIRATLGLEGSGVRFFSAYGDETGSMWAEARAEMREHLSAGTQLSAVAGAKSAFAYLLSCFESRYALVR